jgi:hypothetical protein
MLSFCQLKENVEESANEWGIERASETSRKAKAALLAFQKSSVLFWLPKEHSRHFSLLFCD